MRRCTFEIREEQDAHIQTIAKRSGLDRSQVVRLALGQGLPVLDEHLEGDAVNFMQLSIEERLREAESKSIKKPGAKRAGSKRRA